MPRSDARVAAVDAPYRERAQAVLGSLRSYFLEMPRGDAFCERDDFERGYKALRKATRRGAELSGEALLSAIGEEPRAWLVLRCMVGMSPGEAGYLAAEEAAGRGEALIIDQADAREIDARAKRGQQLLFDVPPRGSRQQRYDRLLRTVVPLLVDVLCRPVPAVPPDRIHRRQRPAAGVVDDQRDLANIGRFARHVRPGNNREAHLAIERGVVRHKLFFDQILIEHRMAAVFDH